MTGECASVPQGLDFEKFGLPGDLPACLCYSVRRLWCFFLSRTSSCRLMAWLVESLAANDSGALFTFAVGLENCLTADGSVLRIICFDGRIDGDMD